MYDIVCTYICIVGITLCIQLKHTFKIPRSSKNSAVVRNMLAGVEFSCDGIWVIPPPSLWKETSSDLTDSILLTDKGIFPWSLWLPGPTLLASISDLLTAEGESEDVSWSGSGSVLPFFMSWSSSSTVDTIVSGLTVTVAMETWLCVSAPVFTECTRLCPRVDIFFKGCLEGGCVSLEAWFGLDAMKVLWPGYPPYV